VEYNLHILYTVHRRILSALPIDSGLSGANLLKLSPKPWGKLNRPPSPLGCTASVTAGSRKFSSWFSVCSGWNGDDIGFGLNWGAEGGGGCSGVAGFSGRWESNWVSSGLSL